MALDHGVNVVKFFPAEASGGIKTLKAVAAPYAMMRFVPTGGIVPENLGEYLKFGQVLACGGSWMVSKELLAGKQFDRIRDLAGRRCDWPTRRGLPEENNHENQTRRRIVVSI
jgi:2-dehydro-3-deoxyphosphogluconate aldolase / (4S)-4-hydroxy-2-oxoglutarate aldolase